MNICTYTCAVAVSDCWTSRVENESQRSSCQAQVSLGERTQSRMELPLPVEVDCAGLWSPLQRSASKSEAAREVLARGFADTSRELQHGVQTWVVRGDQHALCDAGVGVWFSCKRLSQPNIRFFPELVEGMKCLRNLNRIYAIRTFRQQGCRAGPRCGFRQRYAEL